jgi:5-methylcytosine-specific restriction endonuclease McrA
LTEGGDNSDDNLMSLCKPCHSSITITAVNQS